MAVRSVAEEVRLQVVSTRSAQSENLHVQHHDWHSEYVRLNFFDTEIPKPVVGTDEDVSSSRQAYVGPTGVG